MKIRSLIIFILLLYAIECDAQSLGIAPMFNHSSNGINISYTHYMQNKKWMLEAGLRTTINTYSINDNKQNFVNYQTGYAWRPWEYLALNTRMARRVVSYKSVSLYPMINLFLPYQSQLYKARYINLPGEVFETYWQAAISLEATIGLYLNIDISDSWSINACSGIGYYYHFYDDKGGYDRTINNHIINGRFFGDKRTKGGGEFVGLDGLPMMSLGLKYNIPPKVKSRNKE